MPYNRPRCPSGNSLYAGNSLSIGQGWSGPQVNRRGIAGISAVVARVEGLQAVLSICPGCSDREYAPAARARGGAHLPALSGPLTFVAARRSTGDKVTCDTPGRWQAAMTR